MQKINFFSHLLGILLISSTFLVACGDTPTATPIPPTATPVPPTATPIPPTATPVPPTATPRPTATPVPPTATPRPTATPTPTPNVEATASAKAQATTTAQTLITANAQATIAALPKPLNYSGTGDKVLVDVKLNKGAAKATISHNGGSNFVVKLLDNDGKLAALVVNEIGTYQGSQYLPVKATGNYAFEIKGDGNWKIDIEDSILVLNSSTPAGPYSGKGDAAISVQVTKSGLAVFKMNHNGKSNFIVKLVSPKDGGLGALLANEIGAYKGEKAQRIDKGEYLINVHADGDWSLEIS